MDVSGDVDALSVVKIHRMFVSPAKTARAILPPPGLAVCHEKLYASMVFFVDIDLVIRRKVDQVDNEYQKTSCVRMPFEHDNNTNIYD